MIILSSCIFLLLLINISSAFDSCEQPLGMESGQIIDEKIMEINPSVTNKASIRLKNPVACSNVRTVLIDLGRLMKITGFAFSSKKDTTATIGYAAFSKYLDLVNSDNDKSILKKSHPFLPAEANEIFVIKTGSQKISINYVFTLRYIKFHFAGPTCIQLEIYGCPEICSSQLDMPNMPSITTATDTSLQFQYRHPITLSGLLVNNSLMGTTLTLNCLQQNNVSLVDRSQNISIPTKVGKNMTIWIPNDLICHQFEIKASKIFQPSDISFLGCSTGCMVKLIKKSTDEVVSSSSYLDNKDFYKPEHSTLNNLEFAWVAQTNTPKEWLQVCFKSSVLVSAIAIQSHGLWGFQRIKRYSLAYSYDAVTFYNYTEDGITKNFPGPESRFGTKVNVLKDTVTVKCIRMMDPDCFKDICTARWEVLGCLKGIPPFIKVDNDVAISKNTNASLTCRINGQQGAKYHWENDNKKVNESYYYVNTSISTRHTDFNHSYQTNLYITNKISTFLISRNDSNCTVVDQTNSVTCFMMYSCVAYYVEGDEKKEQVTISFTRFNGNIGNPHISVTTINATTAEFSWTLPSIIGDFPVVGYHISLIDIFERKMIFNATTNEQQFILKELQQFRNYTFKLAAYNRFNVSSNVTANSFKTIGTSEPVNVEINNATSSSPTISWEPPNEKSSTIWGYMVQCTRGLHEIITRSCSNGCSSIELPQLAPDSVYECKVRAIVNGNPKGIWSPVKFYRTSRGEPCMQPVGMENGVIPDSNITTDVSIGSLRLNSNITCSSNVNSVTIDLGRLMTVTGFAFSSDKDTNATIRYGIDSDNLGNDYNILRSSSLSNDGSDVRVFEIKRLFSRIWFVNDTMTLRYINFNFYNPSCIQLEMYGCSELCSSFLNLTTMRSPSKSLTFQSKHTAVTISGLSIHSPPTKGNVTMVCFNKDQENYTETLTVTSNQSTTIWLQSPIICDKIELATVLGNRTDFDFTFIGCNSECTKRLETSELSASSFLNNKTNVSASYLSNLQSSWVAANGNADEWIQACFKHLVLVAGVAMKSQSYDTFRRVISYNITYAYDPSEEFFQGISEKFSGPTSRYGTKVNELKTPVTAKCIRLTDLSCTGTSQECALRWEILGCQQGIPPVIKMDNDVKTSKNTNAILTCRINGQEGVKYHWENDNKKINESYYHVNKSVIMHSAFNYSYETKLYITHKISTFFTNRNDSNCSVVDQTNSVTCFMTYSCVAYYVEGEEEKEEATVSFTGFNGNVGIPNISVEDINATKALFSWSVPSINADFPVVGYDISLMDCFDGRMIFNGTTNKKQIILKGLQQFRNYTFMISAYNRFNVSSNVTAKSFKTIGTSEPVNVEFYNVTFSSLSISWQPPNEESATIYGYTVQCTRGVHEIVTRSCFNGCSSIELLNLAPDSVYECKVRALVNDNPNGIWSPEKLYRTSRGGPCIQSVGLENGVIPESSIVTDVVTNSLRLNSINACSSNISSVTIDLGTSMTITGFAFSSDKVTNATIRYGIDSDNLGYDYNIVRSSSLSNNGSDVRVFPIERSFSRIWFEDDAITLRYINFTFSNPSCIQLEMYGCSELCSSFLNLPTMQLSSTSLIFQSNHTAVTISGLSIRSSPIKGNVSMVCFKKDQQTYTKTIMYTSNQSITIWLQSAIICDKLELTAVLGNLTDYNVTFIGCHSECTKRLEISKLTSSSMLNDNANASQSYLNNLQSSWVASNGSTDEWIQACFRAPVLVAGLAMKAQSYDTFRRVVSYNITYAYDPSKAFFQGINKKFVGPSNRYSTKVNELKIPVTAKCIRVTDLSCTGGINQRCALRWEVLGCVQGLKPILTSLIDVNVTSNSNASLSCHIYGQPGATYQWEVDGTNISSNTLYHINETIQSMTNLNMSYTLNLYISNTILTMFRQDGNKDCVVNGGNESVDCSLTYTCRAYYVKNYEVEQNTTVHFKGYNGSVGIPIVSVNNITATSAQFLWSAPTITGNFPVIAYHFSLVDDIDGKTLFQETDNSEDKYINNLHPYRNYSFNIYAVNRFNISSKTVIQRFRTAQAAPIAVRNLQVKAHSDVQINITWDLPQTTNGVLSFYFMEIIEANGDTKKINTSKLSLSVDGLDSYTNYTVKVRASTKNNELLGPWKSQNITTKEGKPTAPQNILSHMMDGNFSIQWNEPQEMNGVLQKYKITLRGTKTYFTSFNDSRNLETETTSIVVADKFPGTNYTIHVTAVTGGGEGEVASNNFLTPYAKPNKAHLTNTQDATTGRQQIFLNPIQQLTGPISFYEFAVSNHSGDCFESSIFSDEIMYNQLQSIESILIEKSEEIVQFGTKNFTLELIGEYMFCLRGVVDGTLRGDIGKVMIVRKDLRVIRSLEPGSSTIVINLPAVPITVMFYAVVISTNLSLHIDPLLLVDLRGFNESDPSKPYITGVFEESRKYFTVGNDENYKYLPKKRRSVRSTDRYQNIVNVPLQPDTDHVVSFRAYEDEINFFSSPWKSGKTNKFTSTEANVNTGPQSHLVIAGSIAAVIVLLSLVAIFLVIRRRRQQQGEQFNALELTSIGEDNNAVEVVEDIPETALLRKVPPSTVVIHPKYVPIKLANLQEHWEHLKKDSHHALTEEYQSLDSGQLYQWTEAVVPELKSKNRYANIAAYNHSRVKLQQPTSNGSDYVNASFIHGYNCNDMYIASQGPNAACLGDFWQLVWERNVPIIVMVTRVVETNKKKCDQYWPENGSQTYDNFDVSLSAEETFNDYVIRTFILQKVDSKETRIIQQYHFLAWPDHGVPEFPSDLLNFQHKIRRDNPVEAIQSPILVHCRSHDIHDIPIMMGSAGVGRTGTFICIDNMLKLARERNMVDVFNYVNFMRSRRIHMVQTEDQYMLIYNALFDALTCGITAIPVSNFTIENKKLLSPNQNKTGKNGYELQFDRLNVVTKKLTVDDTKAAMKEANKMKNRSNIFPRDISRVILETSLYDNEDNENYINAVYVNGYKQKDAYIATEHPLETNLYEYWKMILDKKVTTIVTLNSAFENNQTFDKFWPTNKDSWDFGNINATSVDVERVDGKMTTTNVQVSTNNADKSETKFLIFGLERVTNIQESEESLHTCIVSYDGWHDNGTPSNPKELIQLLTTVESKQMQSDSPIVVMCSDGAGRTGTFIAISILMEQLNVEQDIDVFQTVKKIRTARPEFVSNSEQFQLCYKTIQTYLDCFSTYSNFSN